MQNQKKVQLYTSYIKKLLPENFSPIYGIVLGTGLGGLANSIEKIASIPYQKIPNFPTSTVESHKGTFIAGYLSGIPVIVQQGRCHLYEGKTPDEVCSGVRTMKELGISGLILTNAAGAINPLFEAGEIMLIDDHINFTGQSPLTGINVDQWGPRFPDMRQVYNKERNCILENIALSEGIPVKKGVYMGIRGPQLETRAETRAYRMLGADAVGMSTVMEAIAAVHMGLKVTGISCLSNKNLPDCLEETTIEDVIKVAGTTGAIISKLIELALPKLVE